MNARLLALSLCLVSALNFAASIHAQETNSGDFSQPPRDTNSETPQPGALGRRGGIGSIQPGSFGGGGNIESGPAFDIQIENGELSLAYFKRRGQTNPWGTTNSTVPATIDNLSKYLRAIDPNLNIVLSPDVGNFIIPNLKLNTHTPISISRAVSVASGGAVAGPDGPGSGMFGGGLRGTERSLTFIGNRPRESKSSVEVFNLSGYIQSLGKVDDTVIQRKLDELQEIIRSTLQDTGIITSSTDPNFKFHPGTKLLIVIGKPEAIEVTRKIVNALSGQQKSGKEDLLLDMTPPSDQK